MTRLEKTSKAQLLATTDIIVNQKHCRFYKPWATHTVMQQRREPTQVTRRDVSRGLSGLSALTTSPEVDTQQDGLAHMYRQDAVENTCHCTPAYVVACM